MSTTELRVKAVRARLTDSDADVVLVNKASNAAYLTGLVDVFDQSADVVCAITDREALLFTSFIYAKPARPAVEGGPWELREIRGGFYEAVCAEMVERGVGALAIESSVPYGRFRFISEHFGGRVVAVDQWVETLRCVKDPSEMESIAAAAALADAGYEFVLERVGEGRSEREIALDLEVFLRSNGSEGLPFPAIVAGGPNSADPHASVTDRVLSAGDALKLDFGARVDGYCSDLTRTISIGPCESRLEEMHAAVLAASEAGRDALRAGVRASEVDAAARSVLKGLGLAEAFGHGLGHGIGLDVHESPRVGPGSDETLRAGACITIEPGVYVDDFAGVRIEDLVVVTDEGHTVLSTATRELLEV